MKIEGYIGAEMAFAGLPELWMNAAYQNGWHFSGGTQKGQELSIKKVWEELIQSAPLPFDWDLKLSDIDIEIFIGNTQQESANRDYRLTLHAAVTLDFKPSEHVESQLKFETISFTYEKFATEEKKTSIELSLKGNAHLNSELVINDFSFDYTYQHNPETKKTEWQIDGELHVLAFQRLMHFKARAASLEDEQTLHFSFQSSNPILHAAYFKRIPGIEPAMLLKELNDGKAPENGQLLIAGLANDAVEKLPKEYTAEQRAAIEKIIAQARKANDALVAIPDIFNPDKIICRVSPKQFKLNLTRKNKRFESIDFAIGSDLIIYNSFDNYSELFKMEDGIVSTGYNKTEKLFYLNFTSRHLHVKPLNLIATIPGVMTMLQEAFGEKPTNHPKTSAFINMLEVHPKDFTFSKKDKDWQLSGGLKLLLTDKLQEVDKELFNFVEKLFSKAGNARYIQGGINYDSKLGLTLVFENNNGIEVPDLLNRLVKSLDPKFKQTFFEITKIQLDTASDLGESLLLLDRVRLKIAKDVSFDMRVGIGLPSKLNDRFFNKKSKLHGLINTYDRKKFHDAHREKETQKVEYETPFPDDNLIRATLSIGTDGIGGKLDKFNVFNPAKITEEFKDFIKESDGIIIDFNALFKDEKKEYARIKIDNPTFKLDFKTCSFQFSGGMHLLSKAITFPVKPLLKRLIALLPPSEITAELNKMADVFTDSITLKSLSFYDEKNDTLTVNELIDFLKQFLGSQHQTAEIIPKEVVDFMNNNVGQIAKVLPNLLLEYLSIKIPAGIQFNLEVTADKSVSFALEVTEPTEEQKALGYTDYLQCLLPTFQSMMGFRLKKIGLGSGLFNQAIRLDLSGEMIMIDYLQTIPGIGLSILRKANPNDARLQHMVPDVKTFGYRYQIDNLFMLIFPQATIPIPVPIFYDKFAVYGAGLEGSKSEMAIRFPRPKLNIAEIFKSIGDVAKFFQTKEFALPIESYGLERKSVDKPADTFSPAFYAGPVYTELPGLLGYEKQPDGSRKKITLGFKDLRGASVKDLFALAANTAKFSLLSVAEKKRYKIDMGGNRSEYPVNYLVKFLPASQRIGSKNIVLFDVLEANFIWALSTPGEFKDTVFRMISDEQKRVGVSGKSDNWVADEVLKMIPNSDNWTNEQDGVVFFIKGGIKISNDFIIEAVTATAIDAQNGFATGLSLRANLANIFDFEIMGGLQINPESKDNVVSLVGKSHLYIMNKIPVMKGSFSLGIGAQSHFRFNGMLDVFPDELFGEPSPIKLYSGVSKNMKSDITGIIDANGINIGHIDAQGNITPAGLHLEIGELYLSGTTRIVSTATEQLWEVKLRYAATELTLIANFTRVDGGTNMLFSGALNQPIGIPGVLVFSGSDPKNGASGRLLLFKDDQKGFPQLKEFYVDGRIGFLGFEAALTVHINDKVIEFALGSDFKFAGLQSTFALQSKLARDYSTFNATARFDVGLSFTIPKISFWVWFFGWHEVVVFNGCEWNNKFSTHLEINVYNPNAAKDPIDYDLELKLINEEIEKVTREQAAKLEELSQKINGYEKKKQQFKTDLERKAELENRIEALRQGLISLRIMSDLFTAREMKGNSDDNWKVHYDSARDAYFGIANEYISLLDQIGFGDTEQRKVFLNRVDYLEKVFDYIIVHGNLTWGYDKNKIDKVKIEREAPDYDPILRFVLEAYNFKMKYLEKYNLATIPPSEEDAQILKMQADITNLHILHEIFEARRSSGNDPEWKNRYDRARERLLAAVDTYLGSLLLGGWKNEEQKQLFRLRVNYLNKLKENVIVYAYTRFDYTQKNVEDAVLRNHIVDQDIILVLLREVEVKKNEVLAKAGIESLYEASDLPSHKLPEGFGFNQSNYDKNAAYNRLLTKNGLYDYLKDEIIANELTLRKLKERKAQAEIQRANNQNRQPGEFRFELNLQSQLEINGTVIHLPKVVILVAPSNLQDILQNLGGNVLSTIKNSIWNLVLDAFKPKQSSMADNDTVQDTDYEFIWHKETYVSDSALLTASDSSNNKPEGYDEAYDLTKYVKHDG